MLRDAEKQALELEVKKQGLEELMSTLKHGGRSSLTKQVLDWHAKLEDLRLRELHFRRGAEHWEKEAGGLRELTKSQAARIDQLEEEVVKLESALEHHQLELETRGLELDHSEVLLLSRSGLEDEEEDQPLGRTASKEDLQLGLSSAASIIEQPLAAQLEASFARNRALGQTAKELRSKLEAAQQGLETMGRRCRDLEAQALAKERTINDLRLQVRILAGKLQCFAWQFLD